MLTAKLLIIVRIIGATISAGKMRAAEMLGPHLGARPLVRPALD
jgi:hypothetical protein